MSELATLGINPGSKTFWAGVGLIGYGIFLMAHDKNYGAAWPAVMQGVGLIGLRHAISKMTGLPDATVDPTQPTV